MKILLYAWLIITMLKYIITYTGPVGKPVDQRHSFNETMKRLPTLRCALKYDVFISMHCLGTCGVEQRKIFRNSNVSNPRGAEGGSARNLNA